jgi:glycosyltransferase involved in cell wall biosynthesis
MLRIATDIQGLERVLPPGGALRFYSSSEYPNVWGRRFRLLRAALGSQHLVIHFSLPDVIFFTIFLALLPFQRCRLTTLDFFIGNPHRGWLKSVVQWSLGRVDRFLVYFKDSSIFEQTLSLSASRFHYIPFKINALELIRQTPVSDEGYIFCGGRSRRDFKTFFDAVEPLGYPVKVLASPDAEMQPHGSSLAGVRVPPNVEIFTQDQSPEFFVRSMAASRLVVVPILRDSTTQAGIGVYLQAMALGKCVIISSGLGVSDVLAEDVSGQKLAWIVKAGDPDALHEAIKEAWNNDTLRKRYGQISREYAQALGGEDALRRSIIESLP